VALALDTAIPPRRLGRALRRARRSAGLRRTAAAARLGVTTRLLVAWERGTLRVPDDAAAALVDLYGQRLTALVPAREPVSVDLGRIAVGSTIKVLASTAHDDVLAAYVELLRAVRAAEPGKAVALRTNDLEVLAATIGADVDDVEARIVELLRCSAAEARTLHDELRRRMLLVPLAGIALGAAAITGLVADAPGSTGATASHAEVHAAPVAHTTTSSTAPVAPSATTPTTVVPPATPTTVVPPVTTTTMTPLPPPVTTRPTTVVPAPPATAPVTAASAPGTDDPPVGIPEGETPTIVQP
jgi:hypothetical protein